jgi:anhydro-N-acetylmuramic acid kinase
MDRVRNVVGCMTGTSLDGLDVSLVQVVGRGTSMQARLLRHAAMPLGDLARRLRHLAEGRPAPAAEFAAAALHLAELHVAAIRSLLHDQRPADLIVVHGQTVYHAPPLSCQLINPWPIAQAFGVPVVYDLRGADIAAGGQGAPITPLADFVLFRSETRTRVVLNLGGFANYTGLPAACDVADVSGGDLCSCNQLLDSLARRVLDRPFDRDGEIAAQGSPHAELLSDLLVQLAAQADAGRSLGSADVLQGWIDSAAAELSPADALRTAVEAVGSVIGGALLKRMPAIDECLVAGGGARNRALFEAIARQVQRPTAATGTHGMPIDAREAAAMGILGALAADGEAVALPQITGRKRTPARSGAWICREAALRP